jgi:cell division protein FtsQ
MSSSQIHRNSSAVMRAERRTVRSVKQPLKPRQPSKKGMIIFAVMLVVVVSTLSVNYQQIAAFVNRPITKVVAENQLQKLDEQEISAMLRPFMGEGFFNFKVDQVKQLLEQHPWIERAAVKRQWPDSLSLVLDEEIAIARWGETELLNNKGEIFRPPGAEGLVSLPKLMGPLDSQIVVMQQYQLISQVVSPTGLRLTGLGLSSRGSWDLELNESMQITAGRSEVIERIKRFVEFYATQPALQTAAIKSIDLRYDNGIAVKNAENELAGVAIR